MNSHRRKLASLVTVLTLLMSGLLLAASPALAEKETYALGNLTVITSSTDEHPEAQDKLDETGDFIAIRFGNDAWFAVVFGSVDRPNYVHMRSYQLEYLGGATVKNKAGETVKEKQSLPIFRRAGQTLTTLVEFKDQGYKVGHGNHSKSIGAGNGLLDFRPALGWQGAASLLGKGEPIQKLVSLKAAWNLSETQVRIDKETRTATIDFSLTATDLPYLYPRDNTPTGEVLEEVTLTFHLVATASQKEVTLPWYEVSVRQDQVLNLTRKAGKTYTGTAIDSSLKYDHLIDGWDYQERDHASRLMLLTYTSFSTYIPGGMAQWLKADFLNRYLPDAEGRVDFETDYEIDQENGQEAHYQAATGRGGNGNGNQGHEDKHNGRPDAKGRVQYKPWNDYLNKTQRVKQNQITFNDNWDRAARFTWVSNVSSTYNNTTTEEELTFQVHGMQTLKNYQVKADRVQKTNRWQEFQSRGVTSGLVLFGGYIYPAGETLFHDPGFEASTVLVEIAGGLQTLLNEMAALQLAQLVLVAVVAVGAVSLTHQRLKR